MSSVSQSQLENSLFIATANTVHYRSPVVDTTVFECDNTNGIVNVRASKDNSSLFAVADSQVVILCDAARGKDKKYKLKDGQVKQ